MSILFSLAARFWPYILAGGIIIALAIALNVTSAKLERAKGKIAQAEAKLIVSNESISRLKQAVMEQNAATIALENEAKRREEASAKALEAATARADANKGIIARLKASAAVARPDGPCEVSDALMEAEGEL